ncbi:MAG: AMP-binding protein [Magnetospirillum sp.]|nr:AMP-binding protein [Magnetospirillum sp.]
MLKIARTYEEACRTFRWRIPDSYNLAFDVCDRQTMAGADGHRTALVFETQDGTVERYTFHALRSLSNRLANVLAAARVTHGDRVIVSFPPSVEAAIALLAVTKMGAIAVPVTPSLGAEPFVLRLADCGAKAVLAGAAAAEAAAAAAREARRPVTILTTGTIPSGALDLWNILGSASETFTPVVTAAADPALLFYPPEVCPSPKGVLHAHRALPGNLPAVEFALGFFAQTGDVLWTAADWMSFEGLLWGILPAWHHGVPVVAQAGAFEPDRALGLIAHHGVRVAFLPTARLKMLADAAAGKPHPVPRALATGPSPLPASLHDAVERALSVGVNEIWGVRETGALAANNIQLMERRSGSPGRAVPGVTVEAAGERQGGILKAGERGMLAASPRIPGAFLGYWGEETPPAAHLPNGWIATGIRGTRDLDGYLWPELEPLDQGTVAVGDSTVPLAEVETVLAAHAQVREAALIVTAAGEIKAFVVPVATAAADVALARELQAWVGARRALHEIPRRVEFVDALPKSEDGKVMRDALVNRPLRLDAPTSDERLTPLRK